MIAQFEHLASTTLARHDLDIVEQQLGYAYNLEADLDNFAAAVGFARQAILSLTHDEGEQLIIAVLPRSAVKLIEKKLGLRRGSLVWKKEFMRRCR